MRQTEFTDSGHAHLTDGRYGPLFLPGNSNAGRFRGAADVDNRSGFPTLLRRYRRTVFLFFGVAIVGAGLYTRLAPKSYKVQTVLEIRGLNQDFMNVRDVSPTGGGAIDQTYIETQIRLMQNESVTARVVQALGGDVASGSRAVTAAKEAAIRKILSTMKVKEEGGSNLVSVSLMGSDPELTADAANELTRQYVEEEQNARLSEAAETDLFLREQLIEAKAKLQSAEDALQTFARNSGIVLTNDSQESVASEHLREVQQGLAQAEVDSAARQAQLDVARHSPGESLPEVLNDPVIREDQNKLRDLRVQLADLSTTMTPENYKVKKLQAQIQDLEHETAHHRSAIIDRLATEERESARRTSLLEQQYRRQLLTATDQGSKQVHFNMLRNEVDVNKQVYQTMVQKVKEAGVMAAFRAPNARVVSAAVAPTVPSAPSLPLSMAMALLLATIGSALYIVVSERRNRSLRIPGETEGLVPYAELAAIPQARISSRPRRTIRSSLGLVKTGEQRRHPMLEHWSSHDGTIMSEAFRMAGTSILMRTEGGTQAKVLLVTGPHPQSGKTMSSANLAISLAEGARKVVVVDGDMRKSGLSRLFRFQNSPGLSELLAGTAEEEALKLIRSTEFPGVWVLPSGRVPESAVRLLQSERLDEVIELLSAEFDFVLLDGPPLLELADARLLAKHAGGIILVCRAGRTKRDELNESWAMLREDGANILGTILNGYDLKTECPTRYNGYLRYNGTYS